MMIWSTKSQQKSTKSQHTHNTSKCTEFDGGSEFYQQMMIWSTKNKQIHNTLKKVFYNYSYLSSSIILLQSFKSDLL